MFSRRPWTWLGLSIVGLLVFVFVGDSSATGPTGSLALELVLEDGANVDQVDWQITGNGMTPLEGTDAATPGSTTSIHVDGIPPGDSYLVALSATSDDGTTTCEGSAGFDVAEDDATQVHVMLKCETASQGGLAGLAALTGTCPYLTSVIVSPLQTSVGFDINVSSAAFDDESDPIEYLWTGTGGSFADPAAQVTTYTCEQEGAQSVTITVSDDAFQSCTENWTVQITCVGGGGCTPDGSAQSAGPVTNRPCGPSSCSEMEACVGGTCQPSALAFVSSTQSDAALGGPRGADTTCANLAAAAGLGGYWFSWTSDSCTSPDQRFEKSTVPYRLLDGTLVSSSWTRLTMNPPPSGEPQLDNSIDIDENGGVVATKIQCGESINVEAGCNVWTHTDVEGRVVASGTDGCLGFTSSDSALGGLDVGDINSVATGWTGDKTFTCGLDHARIYCFEQSTADPIP